MIRTNGQTHHSLSTDGREVVVAMVALPVIADEKMMLVSYSYCTNDEDYHFLPTFVPYARL